MKPVGEPDAGNPHVRFDERGRETELGMGTEALAWPATATPPIAVAAPVLDSTHEGRTGEAGAMGGGGGENAGRVESGWPERAASD